MPSNRINQINKEVKLSNNFEPFNEIHSAGFPEGQFLAQFPDRPELVGLMSAAYHCGAFLLTDDDRLNDLCDRLSQTSGYGKYSDYIDNYNVR